MLCGLVKQTNNFIFHLCYSEIVERFRSDCDSFVSVSSHCCVSHRNPELCRHKNVVGCDVFPQSHHTRILCCFLIIEHYCRVSAVPP